MLNICYVIHFAAFFINIFTVPQNGKIFYTAYTVLYAVAGAGSESCSINLIYENVPREHRVGAFAFKNAIAGLVGFFTTLVMSVLVKRIQANGNMFLGIPAYAQQVVTAFGVLGILILIVYVNTVLRKAYKKKRELSKEEA